MAKKHKASEILKYLAPTDQEAFVSELLDTIKKAKAKNDFSLIDECLEAWEATAELNSIPGFSQRTWERFNSLKAAGKIHG